MPYSVFKKFYPVAIAGGLLVPLVSMAAKFGNITSLLTELLGVFDIILLVIFGIAVIVFSWGIVKYITAAGDATKIKEARSFILWGLVGITILVVIYGLVQFIEQALELPSGEGITPPGVPKP